jgi:hypothetical protein
VRVNADTVWDGTDNLNTLSPPAWVEVTGRVQQDGSLLASDVIVLGRDAFVLGGLVLNAAPANGPADNMTLLVRHEMPDLSSIAVGRPSTVNFEAGTRFDIHHMRLAIEPLLFDRSRLVLGQRVAAGGMFDTSTTPETLHVRRVVLHRQGLEGTVVPGSVKVVSPGVVEFQLQADGIFGYLFGEPIKVVTNHRMRWFGMAASDLINERHVRVVGLILRGNDNKPTMFTHFVFRDVR